MTTKVTTNLQQKLTVKIQTGQPIISAYLTLGYPDLETSIQIVIAVAKAGADIIEIGLPFSDPMADGPTIQHTNEVALSNGLQVSSVETAVKQLREETEVAIVIMTYANVLYQFPLDRYIDLHEFYSLDGVIIPDLPPEEAQDIESLNPIYLVAPNTELNRIDQLAAATHGFLYIVSKLGITGGDYDADSRLQTIYNQLETNHPELPRLQGFGIDSLESVQNAMGNGAHGVVIGSKLLKLIGDDGDNQAVIDFIQTLQRK